MIIFAKKLCNVNQAAGDEIVNQVIDVLINLRNDVDKKETPENESPCFKTNKKIKDSKY